MALHITSKTKPLRVQPASKDELRFLIKEALEQQGPDADLNFIDTSEITDMSHLFSFVADPYVIHPRNIKFDEWNTSKVTDMSFMFTDCVMLRCDPSKWDVSGVRDMSNMFEDCREFDCDFSSWDTSSVLNISKMFVGCWRFRGDGLPGWNVQSLQRMDGAFQGCHILGCDLSGWEFSGPVNMLYAFDGCYSFNKEHKPQQVHRTTKSPQSILTAINNLAALQNAAMNRYNCNDGLIMNEELYNKMFND